MPTLGFTATIQSVEIPTRASDVKQATLVAPGFATAFDSTLCHSDPLLHLYLSRRNPRYPILCCICTPVELAASSVADNDRLRN